MRRVPAWVIGVWLAWLVLTTATRVPLWADELALWREATIESPAKPRPWVNLGVQLHARGELDAAERAFAEAMRRAGHPTRDETERRIGIALALANRAMRRWSAGDQSGAVRLVAEARAVAPRLTEVEALERWMRRVRSP